MIRPTSASVSNFMQSFGSWLVRVGLAPPPNEASANALTNEQRQALERLRFLAVPRPPRAPR
jgi:endonuclease YncB( thermonuclease family)